MLFFLLHREKFGIPANAIPLIHNITVTPQLYEALDLLGLKFDVTPLVYNRWKKRSVGIMLEYLFNLLWLIEYYIYKVNNAIIPK